MDWVSLVVIIGYVIGFTVIWYYQREQNKMLRGEVKSLSAKRNIPEMGTLIKK